MIIMIFFNYATEMYKVNAYTNIYYIVYKYAVQDNIISVYNINYNI